MGPARRLRAEHTWSTAPDCDQMVAFCDENLRQCDWILHLVARALLVNLLVFFFFILVKGWIKESGMTGGREMCVRGGGNAEWHCKWLVCEEGECSLSANNGETNSWCLFCSPISLTQLMSPSLKTQEWQKRAEKTVFVKNGCVNVTG